MNRLKQWEISSRGTNRQIWIKLRYTRRANRKNYATIYTGVH
jgi:hypothetical protein